VVATHEWDLTADLPVVDAYLGVKGITRIPNREAIKLRAYCNNTCDRGRELQSGVFGENA
jgi:hypothetical protein